MLLKRALTAAVVVSLESGVPEADAAELDPTTADAMIDEGGKTAETAEEAIHRLHTAKTSLEELQEMLSTLSKSNEGLNTQGAMAVGIALEHITETMRYPHSELTDLQVSLEDFAGENAVPSTVKVLEFVTAFLDAISKTPA